MNPSKLNQFLKKFLIFLDQIKKQKKQCYTKSLLKTIKFCFVRLYSEQKFSTVLDENVLTNFKY